MLAIPDKESWRSALATCAPASTSDSPHESAPPSQAQLVTSAAWDTQLETHAGTPVGRVNS